MAKKMVIPRADKYQLTVEQYANATAKEGGHADAQEWSFETSCLTQDVYQLLDTFITELRNVLPCDGVEYNEDNLGLYFMDGVLGHHRCEYKITLGDQLLGDICFFRENKFQDSELITIENLLAGLVQPLRNSLHFQGAVSHAIRDDLTGLRNSTAYYDNIAYEIERSRRYKIPFSLLLLNLDNFMELNNRYGRDAGNKVLIEVASRLENQARSSDIIFRKDGDEFLVFLSNTTLSAAITAAERIKEAVLSGPYLFHKNEIHFTMSIGVVTVLPNDSACKLIDRADKALYHAKVLGKDRIQAEPRIEHVFQE